MTAALVTAVILVMVLIALIRVNRAPDFVVWAGVGALLVAPYRPAADSSWQFGVLEPAAAFGGLSNPGVVAIGALFIVAAGLRNTGALNLLTGRVLGAPTSERLAQSRLVWPTAVLSGFLNNTPLVAMLLPVTGSWAKRYGLSLSRLLMPLSFASILGGSCTLIGTSTNLVVDGWLIENVGHPGLGMFEVSVVAVPIAVIGITFMLLSVGWLLPERRPVLRQTGDAREYVVEMVVAANADFIGKNIEEAGLRGLPGLFLIEIERDDAILPAVSSNVRLEAGDRLVFAGVVDSIVDLQQIPGLNPATNQVFKIDLNRHNRRLIEAVVSNTCPLIGQSIREGRFRTLYSAAVIAVARNGTRVGGKIGDIELEPGDTLLLEARPDFIAQQRNRRDFYLVSEIDTDKPALTERAALSIVVITLMVGAVASGLLTMQYASLLAALAMVGTGCCTATSARRAIDWEVLLVIAGAIALGNAMAASGLADSLGLALQKALGSSPTLMLAGTFAATAVLSSLVTAKAAAVLMLPVANAAALGLGVDFMPFAIAVMLAAATALATPIGYPTNLMIYGPGGYRFGDYLRLGGPLTVVVFILAIILIPLRWPFAP